MLGRNQPVGIAREQGLDARPRYPSVAATSDPHGAQIASIDHPRDPCPSCDRRFAVEQLGNVTESQEPWFHHASMHSAILNDVESDSGRPEKTHLDVCANCGERHDDDFDQAPPLHDRVRAIFGNTSRVTLTVVGRDEPVVGLLGTLNGRPVIVPAGKNPSRSVPLLEPIGEVVLRSQGRPRGKGIRGEVIKRYNAAIGDRESHDDAVETARQDVGWGQPRPSDYGVDDRPELEEYVREVAAGRGREAVERVIREDRRRLRDQ